MLKSSATYCKSLQSFRNWVSLSKVHSLLAHTSPTSSLNEAINKWLEIVNLEYSEWKRGLLGFKSKMRRVLPRPFYNYNTRLQIKELTSRQQSCYLSETRGRTAFHLQEANSSPTRFAHRTALPNNQAIPWLRRGNQNHYLPRTQNNKSTKPTSLIGRPTTSLTSHPFATLGFPNQDRTGWGKTFSLLLSSLIISYQVLSYITHSALWKGIIERVLKYSGYSSGFALITSRDGGVLLVLSRAFGLVREMGYW